MRWLLPALLLFCAAQLQAQTDPRKDWDKFRAAMGENASGPTGMYSIQDMVPLAPGETAYLTDAAPVEKIRWTTKAPGKTGTVSVTFQNGKATVKGAGAQDIDLSQAKDKQVRLPNGLIVRGTPLESSLKIWLYNPKLPAMRQFKALTFFPYDPKGVVTGRFERKAVPEGISHLDSRNHTGMMYWVGDLDITLQGKAYKLRAFNKERDWTKIDNVVFLLRDKTSNKTSYGGGRVLEVTFPRNASPTAMTVNMNTLYSFLCAHSSFYNCPINLTTFIDQDLPYGEKYPPNAKPES